jgi:hypothetical protein
MWSKVVELFRGEPGRVMALVMSCMAALVAFGVHLSDPQQEAIKGLVVTVLALFGAAEVARGQTVPALPPAAPEAK